MQHGNNMDQAAAPLLEYGVIGALCLLLLIAVRYLFLEHEKNSKIWQELAINSQNNFLEISVKQNQTNDKLIEIRERDVDQAKNFHFEISKKIDEHTSRILKEVEYRKTKEIQYRNENVTPA